MTWIRASLLALLVAGCGSETWDFDDDVICFCTDAPDSAPILPCGLFPQSGCTSGEKCTWVRVSTGPSYAEQLGQLSCAPQGDVPIGGTCNWGASGAYTGFDNCIAGSICVASPAAEMATGTCEPICDLSTNECPDGTGCIESMKYFGNGNVYFEPPAAGVCYPSCDPLTQVRLGDGAPACGSTEVPAELGCYGFPSDDANLTEFVCLPAGTGGHGSMVTPIVLVNSCAPGAIPAVRDALMPVPCIAYCRPRTINNTTPPEDRLGAPPYSCSDVGANAPGERCQHLWYYEDAESRRTAASNDYGLCVDFSQQVWDDDSDPSTPSVPWPLPETLTPYVDPINVVPTEDLFWGTAPVPLPP